MTDGDRQRRDRMAEELRHFAGGRTTNDEFEDRLHAILKERTVGLKEDDAALWAITSRSWFLYDDTRVHRLDGKRKLNREARKEIARWIVFLHSDLPYEWPMRNFISINSCLLNLLTLGLAQIVLAPLYRKRYGSMGEWSVWPFIRKNDLEQEKKRPRLLTGRSSRYLTPKTGPNSQMSAHQKTPDF